MSNDPKKYEKLMRDRVEFKLHSAEQYLISLRNIEKVTKDISDDRVFLEAETAIDGFLSQLISAKDSLLFQINEKLQLDIQPKDVKIGRVQTKLEEVRKGKLLQELSEAFSKDNWLWQLNEYRNHTPHRS